MVQILCVVISCSGQQAVKDARTFLLYLLLINPLVRVLLI